MKFRELFEANELSIEEFMESVESNFHKHFPNGFIQLKHGTNLTESISGTFGMIGNIKDNNGGYHDNDKMRHTFIMFPVDADKTLWSFKTSIGGIHTNPEEGSYNAMGKIKTKMGNNSKITLAKADIKMAKFFKKLSGLMKDNVDNIYGVEKIDKKYLIFK
jgi:hypothetical protein